MPRRLAVLLGMAACLCACAETGPALLDERGVQPYAAWAHVRGKGYRRTSETLDAAPPGAAPLRVRVVALEAAAPADDRLLVLQPGVLADHRTWRFLAPLLAERGDVLLVDPPGTGGSDAPDPQRHPVPAYTPAWIGRHTLRAVARWQAARGDTRRLVCVGHSLGSAAFVRALTQPAAVGDAEVAAVAARTDALVLIAHPDVTYEEEPAQMRRIAELSDVEVRAGVALGILDTEMADAIRDSTANPARRALRQEAERLAGMLRDPRTRRPAQAMLRRFVERTADGRADPAAVARIVQQERELHLPVLLVWGAQDATLDPAMADRVARRLPRVERLDVADAKHSPHQERPDLVAWRIARFLSEHPSPRGR